MQTRGFKLVKTENDVHYVLAEVKVVGKAAFEMPQEAIRKWQGAPQTGWLTLLLRLFTCSVSDCGLTTFLSRFAGAHLHSYLHSDSICFCTLCYFYVVNQWFPTFFHVDPSLVVVCMYHFSNGLVKWPGKFSFHIGNKWIIVSMCPLQYAHILVGVHVPLVEHHK